VYSVIPVWLLVCIYEAEITVQCDRVLHGKTVNAYAVREDRFDWIPTTAADVTSPTKL